VSSNYSRRTVLRGMGASLALPLFGSQAEAKAQESSAQNLLFVYVPNGMHMPDWRIESGDGPLPQNLPSSLGVLERQRESISVFSGLTLDKARNNGDGPGDHARAAGAFLTCTQPVKADGSVIRVGISADQVAARAFAGSSRFKSLQLGCEPGRQSGQCDSGYPCAYSSNISWSTPHTPMLAETNPRLLFDRLFGVGLAKLSPEERERRLRRRRSVLDFVREDARALSMKLGASDKRKLDEYLTGIRELEQRIERSTDPVAVRFEAPTGIPAEYEDHAALMFDLLALAFETGSTRVATFMLANEGSGHAYRNLDVSEGHHSISHHGEEQPKTAAIASINRFHLELFAAFIDRLNAPSEEGSTLLDQTMIVYGSGIADGNSHEHHNLPILLAGGDGSIPLGRHFISPRETPLANLYLRIFNGLGIRGPRAPLARFGDSTGILAV
jgi:hypothetical protein